MKPHRSAARTAGIAKRAARSRVPGVVEPSTDVTAWPAVPVIPRERWADEGAMLRRRGEVNLWQLGDWLLAGEAWDPQLVEACRITGYSKPYLVNVRRVARAFVPWVRCYTVSWATHLQLLSEPDPEVRAALHRTAIAEQWTLDDAKRAMVQPTTNAAPATYRHRMVRCPNCAHEFPIKGHKV